MAKNENTLMIGGREIPMLLTSYEMNAIQEEVGCTVGQLRDDVFAIEHDVETDVYRCKIRDDGDKVRRFGKLIRILGNAGLEEAGQEPDLTDKWILRNIKPGLLLVYVTLMAAIVNDAMSMETAEAKDGPVDEVLEEENRKKEPGSLPTGESAPAGSSPD